MSEYEAEVRRQVFGWQFTLFLDGERVSLLARANIYRTREAAIEAATLAARDHHELRQPPSRVKIEL